MELFYDERRTRSVWGYIAVPFMVILLGFGILMLIGGLIGDVYWGFRLGLGMAGIFFVFTADRVTRLIDTMTGSSDAEIMRKYPNLICHLPVRGYGTTEFRMSQDRMNLLIDGGRKAMTAYLTQQGLG